MAKQTIQTNLLGATVTFVDDQSAKDEYKKEYGSKWQQSGYDAMTAAKWYGPAFGEDYAGKTGEIVSVYIDNEGGLHHVINLEGKLVDYGANMFNNFIKEVKGA